LNKEVFSEKIVSLRSILWEIVSLDEEEELQALKMMQSISMLVKTQDSKMEKTLKTRKRFKDLGSTRQSQKTMTKVQDQRSHSMKEQAYNKIKTKTKNQELKQQSNLKKSKEA
ncbi:hypothetical protein Tco_0341139, partial [Tanacetum coccineum]